LTYEHIGREEQALLVFSGMKEYGTRLKLYLEHPEKMQGVIYQSKTFRHYLRWFIRRFKPAKLLPDKNLWLCMERNGCFSVRLGRKGPRCVHLSETERYVYRYLCFLHLRRFHLEARKRCRYPAAAMPVVIKDFSDRMDESVDFTALLERARCITSQILVI
jgi:hypothetical protein